MDVKLYEVLNDEKHVQYVAILQKADIEHLFQNTVKTFSFTLVEENIILEPGVRKLVEHNERIIKIVCDEAIEKFRIEGDDGYYEAGIFTNSKKKDLEF
jgi:hypothetical protein